MERETAWHALSIDEALTRLKARLVGLTVVEVEERRAQFGANRLPAAKPTSAWRVLANQLSSVVVALLASGAVLAVVMGDGLEAIAIAGVLAINAGLGFAIDLRARRTMEALARLDQRWCLAWRDGAIRRIPVESLVPGDLIELELGKTVPADARLVSAHGVRVDEAVLTGESVPVTKAAAAHGLDDDTPLADRTTVVHKGTVVVAGAGRAVVTRTGQATEVGRIGALLAGIAEERTPLERRLDALGRRLVWITIAIAALVASLGRLQGLPMGRIVETAIALAVAAVPEGLPAVVTITLAIGLRRMASRHALVRRLAAVEALGSVTVVCTDKTRTLTSGDMRVVRVWTAGLDVSLESPRGDTHGPLISALEIAAKASRLQPARCGEAGIGDPIELAIVTAARGTGVEPTDSDVKSLVPFSSTRRYMAVFRAGGAGLAAFVKGAPVRVLALCDHELTSAGRRPLDLSGKHRLLKVNRAMADDGLHVLAIATGDVHEPSEMAVRRLTFVGFAGLLDPPGDGVPTTIARLREAGLATIMLTGDQRGTALAIGRRLGLTTDTSAVLDGRQAEALSESDLDAALVRTRIFSRITPVTKLAVVRALQRRGEIVAMLGDGVNDAAALKQADVGVTMGRRGSDVAREAASIVLEDDKFETIAAAVEEGRAIYDNIRKFVFYLFSCNLAEIFVVLLLVIMGLPPLLPLQILWLNLITDTAPALALALEPPGADVMRRPPRPPDEALLSRRFLLTTAGYAMLLTATTLVALLTIDDPSGPRVTTAAFMTLAFAELLHLGNARRQEAVLTMARAFSNPYAVAAVLVTGVAQWGAAAWSPARDLLGLAPMTAHDWVVIVGAAAVPAVCGQLGKLVREAAAWRHGVVRTIRSRAHDGTTAVLRDRP